MRKSVFAVFISLAALFAGCSNAHLTEIRQKWKTGPEFRTSGSGEHSTRWTVQTGLEGKWSNGVSTGITYRRRDISEGDGGHDNGVWLEVSYPLWKRSNG